MAAKTRRSRSWALVPLTALLAGGLAACGSSGPAPLAVHCTGHTLPGPDTASADDGSLLAAAPTAVRGQPRQAGSLSASGLPDALDPVNPRDGYKISGWNVEWTAATGGRPQWSVSVRAPGQAGTADLYSPETYTGYAIVIGGPSSRDIAAVSDQGKRGPVCVLPQFVANDGSTTLLPHAGIVITQNPINPIASDNTYWLNGYSTANGKRVWSVSTQTPISEEQVNYIVSGDTVYVWDESTGKIGAYDARTGHQDWLVSSGAYDPAVSGDELVGVGDGHVFALIDTRKASRVEALDRSDGTIDWGRTVPTSANPDVTVSPVGTSLVALAGAGSTDYLLKAATGAAVSSQPIRSGAQPLQLTSAGGQPAVAIQESGGVAVLSPVGSRTIPIPPGKGTSVAIADNEAYVQAGRKNAPVVGYDLATGRRLWTVSSRGVPSYGDLYAFDGGFAVLGSSAALTYS